MQDTKTLTFTAILAALISAAAALFFYLGWLPQLLPAVPCALIFPLTALLLPLAWVQLHRIRPGDCLWGKVSVIASFAVYLSALLALAATPVPGSLWSALLIFVFFDSLLLALTLTVYLLIVFWETLSRR